MKLGKNVSNSTMTLLKPNRLKSVAGKELVGKLASDLEQFGHSPEFVARFSHKLRSDLTNEVRSFDPYLARKGAELYDRAKYGKKWRADFDSFVKIKRNDLAKKLKVSPGSIPDDIVFKAISDSSSRGNKTVDMAIFGE